MALMSAENPQKMAADGNYRFEMKQPVPSYLLALAVGNIHYRATGPRTGVYSEPETVEKAAWELADLEKMVQAAEKLGGPYRWASTTCSCCRRASRWAAWKIRVSPSARR